MLSKGKTRETIGKEGERTATKKTLDERGWKERKRKERNKVCNYKNKKKGKRHDAWHAKKKHRQPLKGRIRAGAGEEIPQASNAVTSTGGKGVCLGAGTSKRGPEGSQQRWPRAAKRH